MCDTVFTQQILLYTHFDQHLSSQKVSVFKCPDCSMHYAQKQLMLDHIKVKRKTEREIRALRCSDILLDPHNPVFVSLQSTHGTLKTIDGPPNLGINLPLSSKPINSLTPNSNSKDSAPLNSLDKEGKKPSSPVKKTAKGTDDRHKKPVSASMSSLGPGWTCKECNRLFTQREVFVAHMKREHGKVINPVLHQDDKIPDKKKW